MGLEKTIEWFEVAIPNPTKEQQCIQIGCHIEEVAEMFDALGLCIFALKIYEVADMFKRCDSFAMEIIDDLDLEELADSLGDQQVTATGVMRNLGIDALGVLNEINRSNFSKFEDGKPVFDENGKITKGKDYTPPNLKPYI